MITCLKNKDMRVRSASKNLPRNLKPGYFNLFVFISWFFVLFKRGGGGGGSFRLLTSFLIPSKNDDNLALKNKTKSIQTGEHEAGA